MSEVWLQQSNTSAAAWLLHETTYFPIFTLFFNVKMQEENPFHGLYF